MLRITFYSYKGGVGRTLALLNVAATLAIHGRKVVAVDLDLEAPGFGLSSFTAHPGGTPQRGVSDFIFDSMVPGDLTAEPYVQPTDLPEAKGRLLLMPSGTRAMELASSLRKFYANPKGDTANIFQVLVAEITERFAPDYLFFDSRTGLADVAGVCTVELPEVLVAFSGLGEQSVTGTQGVLDKLRDHPARMQPVATLLALSPIPRAADLEKATLHNPLQDLPPGKKPGAIMREGTRLYDAVFRAQSRLFSIVLNDFPSVRTSFPRLDARDLLHGLEYDPEVPLSDELQIRRACPLADQYRSLARSITKAHPTDEVFAADEGVLLPMLVDHAGQ